ncbi:D-amino peptidase [Paenibacillus sp. UNCCL117]|uniref:M55 family metallopeptidase n=1 Tax=unclassified Paenibacillus TaxID=185978 RepID=UPI00088335EE|nr:MULTISPECIES: M55 family metallopeptidase [unclassified Paenibacillus]SDD02433.1 D-amino peptidase [Paenibacillus sp. cl123]SFW32487.1 D-amino peptidase [Paenibacillus sp. UNCCL117]
MKWMIRVDMEGLTGVVNMSQVVPGAGEYPFGLSMLKHDLLAVIDGLLQAENDRVVLYDIHFFGTNVEFFSLDPRVSVICGKPNYTPENKAYLQEGYDGMVLLGLHARAERPGSVLNHNYEHDIRVMSVNGLVVGEIGLEALMAGEAGVPLVLVTADSDGAKEARELLPGVLTVTVKESLGDAAALCYPPSVTGELLREGARACAKKAAELKPFVIDGPIELDMQFKPGELFHKLVKRVPEAFVAPDRFVFKGDSVLEAWEKYLVAKA